MKLSQMRSSGIHHILLFGPPKVGKSKLAGGLAKKFKILWFDMENGHEVLYQLSSEEQENIDVIQLPDTRTFPIAIETCLKIVKGGRHEICEKHGKIGCAVCKKAGAAFNIVELSALGPDTVVVFDSITQLTNSAIAHITKNQPEDYKLEYDDWANLGKLMDTFLSAIQNAPYHAVCISHEMEVEMEDGKTKLVATAGTRNFSRNSAKYFGDVVYCEVKNKKHIAASSTTYANNILTGSRSGVSIESMDSISLLPIFAHNFGSAVAVSAPESKTETVKEIETVIPTTPEPTPGVKSSSDLMAKLAEMRAKKGS